jgi:hypothetical protein
VFDIVTIQYLAAFANAKGKGPLAQIFSDDPVEISDFVHRWDKDGVAVYRCVSPLRDGARTRSLETVAEVTQIAVDIDLKDLVETPAEVEEKLLHLPLQPTAVRDSGGGYHVIYELREPIDADDAADMDRVRDVQKRLVDCLMGIRRRATPRRCCASSAPTTPSAGSLYWSRRCGAVVSRSTSPTSRRFSTSCQAKGYLHVSHRRTCYQRTRPRRCRCRPRRYAV